MGSMEAGGHDSRGEPPPSPTSRRDRSRIQSDAHVAAVKKDQGRNRKTKSARDPDQDRATRRSPSHRTETGHVTGPGPGTDLSTPKRTRNTREVAAEATRRSRKEGAAT